MLHLYPLHLVNCWTLIGEGGQRLQHFFCLSAFLLPILAALLGVGEWQGFRGPGKVRGDC